MSGTYVATTTTNTEHGKWRATPHATFNCQLQSVANHKFVTAELAAQNATLKGLLRARSDGVGTWQMFQCVAVGKDQWALKSRVNHKFVTAQLGYPGSLKGVLRAAAAKVGPNERFNFRPIVSCSCYVLKAANSRVRHRRPDELECDERAPAGARHQDHRAAGVHRRRLVSRPVKTTTCVIANEHLNQAHRLRRIPRRFFVNGSSRSL